MSGIATEQYFDLVYDGDFSPDDFDEPDHELVFAPDDEPLSPDDIEDNNQHISAAVRNFFEYASGGLTKPGCAQLFTLQEIDSENALIGYIQRNGRNIGSIMINLDNGSPYELGGRRFLEHLICALNGTEDLRTLNQHKPSWFGFFFIEEMRGYKVGRREGDIIPCKLWGFHIRDWDGNLNVLQKAIARALVRTGLNENESNEMPPQRKEYKNVPPRVTASHSID